MITSSVMTKDPVTLLHDGKVKDAIKLFRSTMFHNFPVVDNEGRPVGCISARAILHAAVPAYVNEKLLAAMEGGPDIGSIYHNLEKIAELPIAEIMDQNIHSVHADTPTSAVAARLTNQLHDTSNILVVDDEGKLIGTISAVDIVSQEERPAQD
jgi:CBS domain-containing protein